ncbi:MAG: circularly permuted type 2 ATP-grasp protein [Hyphomonadaceae bacterium]|nr:circularly permuted type 2 ATP-grasp protein [Hyphomonadaceae bacterium]MBX3511147.1 circularly permuted type 2 ATP-grasp protein [Hyphomonadaceae bacterium]
MFDEMRTQEGAVRAPYQAIAEWLSATGEAALRGRQAEAEALFRRIGITFAVYGEGGDPERLIPFDLIPRVFGASEWRRLSRGVRQRARALNAFLYDVYHRGEILKAGIVPEALVYQNEAFLPAMVGVDPPGRVYSHVVGVDIVRTDSTHFQVLEDNCRTPSGVSYMLENREIMMRMFPQLFATNAVESIDEYPSQLKRTLQEVAPPACKGEPNIVLLTPGPLNSAYYEHSFLADLMGVELVEPGDLFVDEGKVWMRTTRGPQRVDVIYRRIDDAYIDPLAFRADSLLGVAGLFSAYRAGTVTLCSAPGAGIADDKAIYVFTPEMIRFYLGEEPILKNVLTWRCADAGERDHVLANLKDLVVKRVHGSGGYGMLIGPHASKKEIASFRQQILAAPDDFIAQPTLELSSAPTLCADSIDARHVDFRPFCLVGREIRLTPGGLTRVAMRKGSLVVNSSQGGGVKDTWVLSD